MENTDVLIIGAGAAGLMAAYTLSMAGKKVTVLEACNRTGGRIHTIHNASFFNHAELGAEFVHGNLPLSLELLHKAKLTYQAAQGQMWHYNNGTFKQDAAMVEGWDLLIKKLHALKEDMSLDDFLEAHFNEVKFDSLKESVRRYAAGYDTADPKKLSAFAMRNEWENEDDSAQHRINDGYCSLINYLANEIKHNGGAVYLNAPVTHIKWKPGNAVATTADGDTYEAAKVVFAIPLGVWQAPAKAKGHIKIEPPIATQQKVLHQLGFGAIIKVLLQFDELFWEDAATEELAGKGLKNMMFLFSEEAVPTWWTQSPAQSPLLTGWLGGPAAARRASATHQQILQEALESLAHIFNRSPEALKDKLVAWHVANWTAEPYIYGSYAYDTVHTTGVLELLRPGVEDTLYFAGEFMYQGASMGTVEAALLSGRDVAAQI